MEKQRKNGISFVAGRWPLDPECDTIFFLHGAGGTSILWHEQVAALADCMNTIAIDLPGHGESDSRAMDRIKDYAQSVSGFIRSTGAKRPVICGLSMGGAIVLQLLIDEPGYYRAGIAVNSGAKLKTMPFIFDMIAKDYEGFVEGLYKVAISDKTDPLRIKPLIENMKKSCPTVTSGDFKACDTFDVIDQLGTITAPVLVITAADDQLTPVKYGRFMAENIPGAVHVNIEEAGHISPMEKPEAVTRAIQDFLGR